MRRPCRFHLAVVVALPALLGSSCPTPELRPGPVSDGSAQWAWQIAQPRVTAFAADARLYEILGAVIWHDGRLPANTGTWSFVTWSPTLQRELQVTVDHSGTVSTSVRDRTSAPGSGGHPVPAAWANSPVVFQAAEPHRPSDRTTAQLVVFNLETWQTPGLWGINYGSGPNLIVRWDGTYIGTQ